MLQLNRQCKAEILERSSEFDWARRALETLQDSSIEYLGNVERPASNSAEYLAGLYRLRLERSEAIGIDQSGCAELVAALAKLEASQVVEILPFASSTASITAFLTNDGCLVGCVTVSRTDSAT